MATMASIRPPGPKQKFPVPLTNLLAIRRDPLGLLMRLAREYGDLAAFKLGPQQLFLVSHPDCIRDILVTHHRNFMKGEGMQRTKRLVGEGLLTSEDEFHLRQRRLSQPAFHRERIAAYGTTITEYAARMSDEWLPGETRDIADEMTRLTLAITGKTLFDSDVESEAREISDAVNEFIFYFNRMFLPFSNLLEKWPLPAERRLRRARRRLDETVYRMIDEHRQGGSDRGDLLSMLIRARDEENSGSCMTDLQLRDETMTIFVAGHETISNALTWTWYLLSQHPEVETKLAAEVDRVTGGRRPHADDYSQLPYTQMVLAEAMRLYPPIFVMGRRALDDYQIGGYHIPAGSILLMSQYVMHHSETYFPDPFEFDPERWQPEARDSRPKYSYFPFGGGPRVCIGEGLAWMEGVLVLATIAQRWRMRIAPGHRVIVQPIQLLKPKDGMKMILQPRSNVARASAAAGAL
jgi:cytochrome P450